MEAENDSERYLSPNEIRRSSTELRELTKCPTEVVGVLGILALSSFDGTIVPPGNFFILTHPEVSGR